jgi:hypothetical protein
MGREPVPGPYTPVAQQLAVLSGKASAVGAATGLLPEGSGSVAALPASAPAPTPQAMAQAERPIGTPAPAATAPAPTYADPRLNRSGQIREEFNKSGEWRK